MKALWSLVLIAAATTLFAQSQTPTRTSSGANPPPATPAYAPPTAYYGGAGDYPYSYHSSTAAEGYARGMSEVIRAQGDYNLSTSAAAVNLSEAQRQEIENRKVWTQNYYEIREMNRQFREAQLKRERPTPEYWVRYAQAGKPKPLANKELDAVTGEIHWPVLLTAKDYETQRESLDKLFKDRAYRGALGAEDFLTAKRLIGEIGDNLSKHIQDLPTQQYIEAKRFLSSLEYEAHTPAG
jgi:hypothetical protein